MKACDLCKDKTLAQFHIMLREYTPGTDKLIEKWDLCEEHSKSIRQFIKEAAE